MSGCRGSWVWWPELVRDKANKVHWRFLVEKGDIRRVLGVFILHINILVESHWLSLFITQGFRSSFVTRSCWKEQLKRLTIWCLFRGKFTNPGLFGTKLHYVPPCPSFKILALAGRHESGKWWEDGVLCRSDSFSRHALSYYYFHVVIIIILCYHYLIVIFVLLLLSFYVIIIIILLSYFPFRCQDCRWRKMSHPFLKRRDLFSHLLVKGAPLKYYCWIADVMNCQLLQSSWSPKPVRSLSLFLT